MNKKLKLYSTIFIVALVIPIITSVVKYDTSSFSDPKEKDDYSDRGKSRDKYQISKS